MKIASRGINICLVILGIVSFCFGAWFIYKSYQEHKGITSANELLTQYDLRGMVDKSPLTAIEENNLLDNGVLVKRASEANVSLYSMISTFWMSVSALFFGLSSFLLAIPTLQNKKDS